MGKKKKKKTNEEAPAKRPPLPYATSCLLGAWLGLLALATTYLAGVLSGISAPTALIRATIAWAVAWAIGRTVGWYAGSLMETSLRAEEPTPAPEPMTVDAEVSA